MPLYANDHIYCVDIGSIKACNFGWAGVSIDSSGNQFSRDESEDIWKLVDEIAGRLNNGAKVALGFECPLWVPVRDDPKGLTSARAGDGNRSWSAQAGPMSLAAGLTECAWILQTIRNKAPNAMAFLDWHSYEDSGNGLFVWEAFVSGKAKKGSHTEDAMKAVGAFVNALPSPEQANAVIPTPHTLSLIGTSLLWAGWSSELSLLRQPCIVIKA